MKDLTQEIDDCWNKTGVWRTGHIICPRLKNEIHCRNCNVYIDSGLSLLNHDLPDNYRNENTEIYKKAPEETSDENVSLIIFRIQKDWYALRTAIFLEIDNNKPIHKIPHNKNCLLEGLVNIRGELELCISMSALVSAKSPEDNKGKTTTRLIIIKLESGKYALKPDEISGVYKVELQNIDYPPASIADASDNLIVGVFEHDNKHIGMIDDQLLNNKFGALRA